MRFFGFFSFWSVIVGLVAALAALATLWPVPSLYVGPIALASFVLSGVLAEIFARIVRRKRRKDS